MKSNSVFSDLNFLALWNLDFQLKVTDANEKAHGVASDPFSGLTDADKKVLRDHILSNPENHKNGINLPWKKTQEQNSWWFKWSVQKNDAGYYLSATDVSDIKNSEHSLSQILDAIPDLILVKREGSHIVWANKAFQNYYGLNNSELLEMIDAPYVEPDFTQQYIRDDKTVWDSGKQLMIEHEPVIRYDGVIRHFQTMKTPIFDLQNKVKFTVGVSRDITDRIVSEEKAITAAKLAAIGEMSGGMAHEINNPIAVIAGKVFLLKRILNKQDEVSKELVLNYLDTIEGHVERISNIINVLRRFSVTDDFEDFRNVNFLSVLSQTLLLCETKIREKGINLIIQVPEKLMVDLRSVQFGRAVLNLLNNATDAVEHEHEPWIKLTAQEKDGNLVLQVSDSGPGVSEDIENKIFLPFYTTKDVGRGSGLGLSFALSVAKNHNGTLKLNSEVSRSCFMITVPLKQLR